MHRSKSIRPRYFAFCLAVAATLLAVACAEPSPEEKVAAQRALYTAQLNSFSVVEEPVADATVMGEGEMPGDEMSGDQMSGDEMPGDEMSGDEMSGDETTDAGDEAVAAVMPAVPVHRNVLLDILLQNTGKTSLPGITVDITQVDASKQVKATWKAFLEIPNLAFGTTEQVAYMLEGVDYKEGDGFNVEVRSPVPAAERGDYAEF
jgi:pentapeptide MXKDX repeat protein